MQDPRSIGFMFGAPKKIIIKIIIPISSMTWHAGVHDLLAPTPSVYSPGLAAPPKLELTIFSPTISLMSYTSQ
jgi:hypothetical protein